jgi:ribosome-associated protein
MRINIPENEMEFSYARSSGAGGQNVNKLNTKVILKWNFKETKACPKGVIDRLVERYPSKIVDNSYIVMSSQRFRTQKRNKDDCIEKLHLLLDTVRRPPKARKATKPTKSSVKKRIDQKKARGQLKRARNKKIDY